MQTVLIMVTNVAKPQPPFILNAGLLEVPYNHYVKSDIRNQTKHTIRHLRPWSAYDRQETTIFLTVAHVLPLCNFNALLRLGAAVLHSSLTVTKLHFTQE